jgi:hypothetical protein
MADPHAQSTAGGGSRAAGPGSRWRLGLGVAALAVALAVSAGVVLSRPGASAPRAAAARASSYGGIPAWLPKPTVRVGRTVEASAAHPWLAVEGDAVVVNLSRGRVTATTVGPAVPNAGTFPVPATSPCTFTITFRGASAPVPLNPRAFTILDEVGEVHHPRVTTAGGGSPPAWVFPGRTVTLRATDVLPTGNGRLRWAPTGARTVVSWDFAVEID